MKQLPEFFLRCQGIEIDNILMLLASNGMGQIEK